MSGLTSLAALAGDWHLSRRTEHRDGAVNRLEGQCHFTRSGTRLIQDEGGLLEMGAQSFEARQRYIWQADGATLNVFFADMRPFHSVPLHTLHHTTAHLCPPDRYEVTYDFSDWPRWQSQWHVEGPRKAYLMTSLYHPARDCG